MWDLLEWLIDCGPTNITWLSTNRKSKNPVVIQYTRLEVSDALLYIMKSQRSRL